MSDITQKEEVKEKKWNIFDDFSWDINLNEDVVKLEEKKKKDGEYYLALVSSFFKIFNLFLFLFFILSFVYLQIQANTTNNRFTFLDPICGVFLWETPSYGNICAWITETSKKYTDTLNETKKKQFDEIIDILGSLYTMESFIHSKEVNFLLNKTINRLKPLEIFSEFDRLKNEFEPFEKTRIKCFNITFEKWNLVRMHCSAYSSDWDTKIIGFDWVKNEKIEGTSVSLANSFINYIDKNAVNFTLKDKQKTFSASWVKWSWLYTQKTDFSLLLEYRNNNL